MSFIIKSGPEAFQYLSGVFTVYKPYSISFLKFRKLILQKLVEDLNLFKPRPLREKIRITGSFFDSNLNVEKYKTLSDHPCVIGPRYQEKDFQLSVLDNIGKDFTGVIPVGISSNGCFLIHKLRLVNLIKEFEIVCRLGICTKTCMENDEVKFKSSYKHLSLSKINYIFSKTVTSSIKIAFKSIGVNMYSQEAYDLIENGPIRPALKSDPVIYGLKCLSFKPPYMKLVIHVINENPIFLKNFIFELGAELKTYMCISSVLCTRIGKFTLDDCLLIKDLNVESVLKNISNVNNTVKEMLELDKNAVTISNINKKDNYDEKVKLHKYEIKDSLF